MQVYGIVCAAFFVLTSKILLLNVFSEIVVMTLTIIIAHGENAMELNSGLYI